MKRFFWPLQRLLEVTVQRERALRVELFGLSRRIAAVHQEIFRRRAQMRMVLADLGREPLAQRLPRQAVFLRYAAGELDHLAALQERLQSLQTQRRETMAALAKKRSFREALERLREEAYQRYVQEATRQEQKQLDETSQVAFVRGLLEGRPHDNSRV